ncbi:MULTISPECIES: DUF1120 domain-containing protein [Escherichia]|uniref:DUF1120 domain-containing protein n=1 Tax=Escherichia TaxID=561 RepID=UPI0002BBDDFB|nr:MULTISPECIES: DUF1120 domain-containing protein [Escherichia]EFB2832759.1 DUF1120 domain-containing protein [Escherichia coli]EFC1526509.1 DUF1120 domain-containing protein [Escherichia coli]EFC9527038.1 DUF1120 domain-containing protein [Escherichia coli]EFE0635041.1 DUF1120 domain-containing protein [Escherichia coli]EFN7662207.1 DUF1120 domain-containing protein [Escherichia coli]
MLFKKSLTTAAICAALAVTSFNVMAADTTVTSDATLTVVGEFNPGACTPEFTGGGIIDYGKHPNMALNPTGVTNTLVQLGRKTTTLTIKCTAPTLFAITSFDNRLDSRLPLSGTAYVAKAFGKQMDMANTSNGFGLGLAPNGQKIGAFTIGIDTMAGAVTASDDTGDLTVDVIQTGDFTPAVPTWIKSDTGSIISTNGAKNRAYSVAKTGELTPVAITMAQFPLLIDAAVQDNTVLGTTEVIKLDGNVTLQVLYL